MDNYISFIPIGGIGDVTKNMSLYEYKNEILIVDCGLGFADETMLGVDLLLPDISYLLSSPKKIKGMVLTHGHEDHIGGLPFILPQLLKKEPGLTILATPLTAALANEKLKEFKIPPIVKTVTFSEEEKLLGSFKVSFIRVNHSVPDTSNLFIKTPVGNFYHASDFKFDLTPEDGKRADFYKIARAGRDSVLCLASDCLNAEKHGATETERILFNNLKNEVEGCMGKFLLTTYSSNISRLQQAVKLAEKEHRKVCFVGRSLIKTKDVAQRLNYLKIPKGLEIQIENIKSYKSNELFLLVAGSQGQENSAMTRIAGGEHRDVKLNPDDVVVFSAESIPGNEVAVNSLIDTISKRGTKVLYEGNAPTLHVSGHGSSNDLMLMMTLLAPRKLIPIGGTYRQMVAYKELAKRLGYKDKDVFLLENGQEVMFYREDVRLGRKIETRNVYVDEITGEEVESFVLRDRQKLSEGGIAILIAEIDSSTGQLVNQIDVIIRGLPIKDLKKFKNDMDRKLKEALKDKRGRVTNWVYLRKLLGEVSERFIFKEFQRRPLVLPVVIEV